MGENRGAERAVTDNGQALERAVVHLSSQASSVRKCWLQSLKRCTSCGPHAGVLAQLHVVGEVGDLPSGKSHVYRTESQAQGQALASGGVPAECVTIAIALYLECCVPILISGEDNGVQWILALARWASLYQFFLLSGYSLHEEAERAALEEKISLAERRVQDFSVELADAYEAERRRLARDLHDEIGHDLIVLKLYTQVIALDLKKGEISQVRRKLKESVSLIKHALESVRHLTFDLGPAIWNEQGFVPAIRFYVQQFAARTGLKVGLRSARLNGTLPARYETALYKVLQGALSNIAAHADAERVAITLQRNRDNVMMRIQDDGRGFNVGKTLSTPPKCFGLRAMQDRIELLGGTITFLSHSGRRPAGQHGTTIEFVLPLQEIETK